MPLHFDDADADAFERGPRCVHLAAVAAQVARVVVRHGLPGGRPGRQQFAFGEQFGQQLRVMAHIEMPAKRRVLVREAVEEVRIGRDDALETPCLQGGNQLRGQALEAGFVTEAAREIAAVGLGGAEQRDRKPRLLQRLDERAQCLLVAHVVAALAHQDQPVGRVCGA